MPKSSIRPCRLGAPSGLETFAILENLLPFQSSSPSSNPIRTKRAGSDLLWECIPAAAQASLDWDYMPVSRAIPASMAHPISRFPHSEDKNSFLPGDSHVAQ